jgi:hypothetical protein
MYKSLIIILLCFLPFALAAQSQSYIDAKCAELASDEARAEAELKRIQREKAKLNATKIELQVSLYNKQLTDLELKKASDIAKIESDYLRAKGEIMAKMQVATSVSMNPSCTQ